MPEPAPSRRIPFIDLKPLVAEVTSDALAAFAEQLRQCEFVEGPSVARLEQVLSSELGLPHAVACSNGSDALVLGLRALGVRPGHKVALPDLTFWASYEAIVEVGAVPVLIDIDPDDLQMSFARFVEASERMALDAAILVHLFGWASARVEDFRSFARERRILLLEDAAQAFGVRTGSAPLLAGAQAATLSFFPAKVIGAPMRRRRRNVSAIGLPPWLAPSRTTGAPLTMHTRTSAITRAWRRWLRRIFWQCVPGAIAFLPNGARLLRATGPESRVAARGFALSGRRPASKATAISAWSPATKTTERGWRPGSSSAESAARASIQLRSMRKLRQAPPSAAASSWKARASAGAS